VQRRWKVLLVTAVAVFMSFLDVTIVNIAFPSIEAAFPDASRAGLSWVLNAYNIVFAALLVPAGRLADLVGRRRVFLAGIGLFLVASALCALAPSVAVLVAARVLQAVGAALLVPTSLGLLLPEFPVEQRATATAIWGATGAVAAATGPALGGVLVDAADWRLVFLVNLPIGLAALVPARRLLTEARDPARGAVPDLAGAALLTAGVALVALGIVQGPEWGWGGADVLGALGVGVLLLVLLVARSRSVAAPVVELDLFRVRSFAVANAAMVVYAMAFYALLLCNVLFLTGVWGYDVLTAGVALTPAPLMAAVSAPIGGRLSDRFGQRVVAVPGILLFSAGALLYATSMDATPDWASEFLPAAVVGGTGVGLTFAALGSAAVAELPPARFATGSAVAACARQIGAVLGISGLVAVLGAPAPAEAVDVFQRAWLLMAGAGLIAAALAVALGRVRAAVPVPVPVPAVPVAPATSAAPSAG
jgi:EmrB/QacA subfamily drug resistance transporter